MKAKLVAFKGRRRDVANNYGIIEAEGKNPAALIGRKVTWKSLGGKRIGGVIVRTHGRDALLVRFRKGLPGEAVGDLLELQEKRPRKKTKKKGKKPPTKTKKSGGTTKKR
jgi:ribosomal protein L35AE/L33A